MNRRRVALYATVVALLGVYAVVRTRILRARVDQIIMQSIEGSIPSTLTEIATWVNSRQAQASLLALVAEQDPATRVPSISAASRYGAILRSLDARDGYQSGWVTTSAGVLIAVAGDPTSQPPIASDSGVVTTVIGNTVMLDFSATTPSSRVVLRSALSDSSFPGLNPAPPNILTGRTTLFARRGDSVYAVLTRTNGAARLPSYAFDARSAPGAIRALATSSPSRGFIPGINGAREAYVAVALPISGWMMLREQEVDEVLRPIYPALAIEIGLVSLVLILVTIVGDYLLRSSRLRRESELTRIRADFVSSVSHELRTPLAQIRMYAELLRKGSMRTPADTEKALSVIEKESHRLNILVDNVLNFTRLRRQSSGVVSVPTRVDDDITHVIAAFEPLARERAVTIVTDVEPGLRAAVDSLALRQIVLNFLENAVKYGPVGQTVHVGACAVGRRAKIWVDDQGPGINTAEREAVWLAFVRGNAAAEGVTSGSGIGLAVVKDLVLQHGGTYDIERTDAGGARFVVEFPQFG